MTAPNEHIPDILLERYLANDLSPARAKVIEQQLTASKVLQERLGILKQERDAFLINDPPELFAHRVAVSVATRKLKKQLLLRLGYFLAPVGAGALVLFLVTSRPETLKTPQPTTFNEENVQIAKPVVESKTQSDIIEVINDKVKEGDHKLAIADEQEAPITQQKRSLDKSKPSLKHSQLQKSPPTATTSEVFKDTAKRRISVVGRKTQPSRNYAQPPKVSIKNKDKAADSRVVIGWAEIDDAKEPAPLAKNIDREMNNKALTGGGVGQGTSTHLGELPYERADKHKKGVYAKAPAAKPAPQPQTPTAPVSKWAEEKADRIASKKEAPPLKEAQLEAAPDLDSINSESVADITLATPATSASRAKAQENLKENAKDKYQATITIEGDIDKAKVKKIINTHKKTLMELWYAEIAEERPLNFSITINTNGQVTGVNIINKNVSKKLKSKIIAKILTWQFPYTNDNNLSTINVKLQPSTNY
ncbi:MAG: hypothetical protein JW841_08650 [Deltaproteobacteria bacterium]|nr:hypothetical protein [Deltaproteobacteria bacterium]